MGGSLSSHHGKPGKNISIAKNSPSKNSPSKISPSKNLLSKSSSSSSSSTPFKSPPSIKRSDSILPIQDRRISNQESRISNQESRISNQEPVTSNQKPIATYQEHNTSNQESSTSKPVPNESEWKNHSEPELETLLLSKLDKAYDEALSRLITLGYERRNALRAILSSGHCQGHFDLLTNILKNSIKYLTYPNEKVITFTSLRQLEEHSLSDLISSLQKNNENLSRSDAMRYLLAHQLHVGGAAGMKLAPNIPATTCLFKPIQSTLNSPPVQENINGNESEKKEEKTEDGSDEEDEIDMDTLHDALHQIYDIFTQVNEIREWAQEKALQAAKKLSADLVQLRTLRMMKENGQRMQKEAEAKIAEMEKQLEELEEEVKRTVEELEGVQMEVKSLELENKEIKAELEAAKLSGADSSKTFQRLEKKVKKLEKNCEAGEKQKTELKEDLAEVKRKKRDAQHELDAVRQANRELKAKVKEEARMREQATRQGNTERKLIESTKVNSKKKLQFIISKHQLDTKRHGNQAEILHCEISRLNDAILSASSSSAKLCRPCIFCDMAEAAMVFLPCRHEVLCSGCGKDYEDIGSTSCPLCNVKITETIYIYGLS